MEERNQPRRPRRDAEQPQQKSESLIYGKNPVTEQIDLFQRRVASI